MLTVENNTPDWALIENVKQQAQHGTHLARGASSDALFVERGSGTLGDRRGALAVRPGKAVVNGVPVTVETKTSIDIDGGVGNPRRDVLVLQEDGTFVVKKGDPDPAVYPSSLPREARSLTDNAYRPAPDDLHSGDGLALAVITIPANSGTLPTGGIRQLRPRAPHGSGGGGSGAGVANAADFGGVNGGAQIQAAIDSLGAAGGIAVVPADGPDSLAGSVPGWRLSSPIELPSGVRIVGAGTALQLDGNGNTPLFKIGSSIAGSPTVSDIHISGFVLDGNRQSTQQWTRDDGKTDNPGAVNITRGRNITVRDCVMTDCRGYAVKASLSSRIRVIDCESSKMRDDGFTATDTKFASELPANRSHDIWFVRCYAHDNYQTGIEVDDGPRDVYLIDCRSDNDTIGMRSHTHGADKSGGVSPENIWIVRPRVENADRYGVAFGSNPAGDPHGYHVVDPVIRGAGMSAIVDSDHSVYGPQQTIDNLTIDNPTIEHSGSEAAIAFNTPGKLTHASVSGGAIATAGGSTDVAIGGDATGIRLDDLGDVSVTDSGTKTRWNGVLGGGPLGGVDLSAVSGQFGGDRAVADGTGPATAGALAAWDAAAGQWRVFNPSATV